MLKVFYTHDISWASWDLYGHFLGGPEDDLRWGNRLPGFASDDHYFVGDFNGDKAQDIARLHSEAYWFVVNARNGAPFAAPWWGYQIPGWPVDGRYFVGDFNGDGAADIAFLSADAKWYIVNGRNGGSFPALWWGYQIPGWPADGRYFVGDFDGDGAADIAYLSADARWYIVNGRNGGPRGIQEAWRRWTTSGFRNPQRVKKRHLFGPRE